MSETTSNTAAEPRPKPKRKFEIRIGAVAVTKRCSVEDMAKLLDTTSGVSATLELDGYRFEMMEEDE